MHCSHGSTLQHQLLPKRCCGRTADCRGSRVTLLTPAAAAVSQPATATAVQAASLAVPPPQQQLQQQQMPQLSHQLPVKYWHMQQPTHQQPLKQSQEQLQLAGQQQPSPLFPQQMQQHWQHQDPDVGQVAAAGIHVPAWADSLGKAGTDSSSSKTSTTASSSRSNSSSKAQYGLSQTLALLRRSSSNTAADAARAAPHLLTSAITQCETLSEVMQVMCEMSSSFNNVHVAAMMARLPKILRCQQQQQQQHTSAPITSGLTQSEQQDLTQLLQDLSQLSEEVLPSCSPREMVNIAWGFAALGFYNRRLLQLLLGRCTLSALKPQELSALTWAVAQLGHEVSGLWVDELLVLSARVLQAGGFKPQEAANLAWGLAVLQRQCMASSVTASRHSCTRVDAAWKAGFCRAVEPQLGYWGAADVSQTLWALAVLGFSGIQQQWLDKVLIRGLQLLSQGHLQSRHASVILWSVMQLQQQQQWAAASAAAADTTSGSTSSSSSNSSSSSGPVVSPTVAVFAAAVASKLPLLLRGERRPLRFAAVLLFSCQKLKMQPPVAAMDYLIAAAGRQLEGLDLTSAAAHPPSALLGSSSGSGSSSCRSQGQQQQGQRQPCSTLLLDVSMLLYSFTQLSYRPGQKLLDLVAAAVADRSWRVVDCHDALAATKEAWELLQEQRQQQQEENEGQLGGQQASSSCDAMTAYKQQQILQQRQELLKELHSSMHGREASLLLWSMAKLRYQPSAALLRPLKMAALRQRQQFNATDVGVMLWALARMRHKSGYVWLRFMLEHFLAHVDDRVPGAADVCNVVHALPHLPGGNNQCYVLRQKVGEQVLQGLADAAASRFSECGPRELVQLAQGFALLGFTPAAPWLQQHQQRAQVLGKPAFSKQEKRILSMAYRRLSATPRPRCDGQHPQHSRQQLQLQQQQLSVAAGSSG